MMAAWKLAAPIAAGCTIVLKPSEITPLSTLRLAELLQDVLPKGVLNVIHGGGPTIGDQLINSPQMEAITVTGNLKLDTDLPELTRVERLALRTELGFGPDDLIVVGASTWPGEEQALLQACVSWWSDSSRPKLRLLLVPRHAERRSDVIAICKQSGVSFHVRTRGAAERTVQVCLADTTGELSRLVQLGDVVWIGKSLPPHAEGQTPVEAARLGRPVLFGPDLNNFRAIAAALVERGAARSVPDAAAMKNEILTLLADPAARDSMSQAGRAWHATNQGARERTLHRLKEILETTAERKVTSS